MRLKLLFSFIYSTLLVFILASFSSADDVVPKGPVAFFPDPRYAFELTLEGKELLHDFVIMNKGDSMLEVKKVNPG